MLEYEYASSDVNIVMMMFFELFLQFYSEKFLSRTFSLLSTSEDNVNVLMRVVINVRI